MTLCLLLIVKEGKNNKESGHLAVGIDEFAIDPADHGDGRPGFEILKGRAEQGSLEKFLNALSKAPTTEPESEDRIG